MARSLLGNTGLVREMSKPKGGRGKQAEYDSKLMRVPEPLWEDVERLKDAFYGEAIASDSGGAGQLPPVATAIEIAQDILKSKKSARVSLERLLKALYGDEVKL